MRLAREIRYFAALALTLTLTLTGCGDGAAAEVPTDLGWTKIRDFALPWSTDDAGSVAPPDLSLPGRGDAGQNGKGGPPYPIVLVHGMAGFRNIGPIGYFHKVPDALRADGHDVWISVADPINDSEARGRQVASFVLQVLNATGKDKVNLVGHSQGGFDVRYVASTMGAFVGACVEVSSPMKGTPIADAATGAGPGAKALASFFLELYGGVGGFDSSAMKSVSQFTGANAAAFFQRHPDDARVRYFSIAGRSAISDGGADCATPGAPAFVSAWDRFRDPLDPFFGIPSAYLDGLKPKPVHDGVVPVLSARHGTFLGCIPADHMDEVNLLAGDSPGLGNAFDAVKFYRDLAGYLVAQGY